MDLRRIFENLVSIPPASITTTVPWCLSIDISIQGVVMPRHRLDFHDEPDPRPRDRWGRFVRVTEYFDAPPDEDDEEDSYDDYDDEDDSYDDMEDDSRR